MKKRQNFPGIDLADDDAKVAIQVTSDKSLEKVKDSLKKIISACPETTCFCEYPGRINSSGRWHRSSVAN